MYVRLTRKIVWNGNMVCVSVCMRVSVFVSPVDLL